MRYDNVLLNGQNAITAVQVLSQRKFNNFAEIKSVTESFRIASNYARLTACILIAEDLEIEIPVEVDKLRKKFNAGIGVIDDFIELSNLIFLK